MSGTLFIVATPIGNLEDLGERARRSLAGADIIACEDTRRTGRLLARLGIRGRLLSLHEHNEGRRVPRLLAALTEGAKVALVSDAGTPLISDPGYVLVREAAERGIRVVSVPGPSAVLAALTSSGLPPYPFTFAGFPPSKKNRRRKFYARFADLDHTLVLFESPHRLAASLEDALESFGDRPAALGRELTKLHEEILLGTLSELLAEVERRGTVKGEITLVVGRRPEDSGPPAGSFEPRPGE